LGLKHNDTTALLQLAINGWTLQKLTQTESNFAPTFLQLT